MIRVIPDMARAKAHWVKRSSEIPDYLIVPMSDGTVCMYVPQVVQPGFVKAMENIKNMKTGYPNGGVLPGQMTIDDFIRSENDESTL